MEKLKDYEFVEYQFPTSPTSVKIALDNTTSSLSEPVSSCQSPFSSDHHHHHSPSFFTSSGEIPTGKKLQKKKLERKSESFAYRIREHVRLGNKLSDTVKGKLSVGAKIIKKGGRENIFRDIFGVNDDEKLLKASQCYLSTTAGPIAGILFVSTQKIAFCSERSIHVNVVVHRSSSVSEELITTIRTPYKVSIPVKKIKGAYESENVNNPAQKYIQIVTQDNYEFWFMGFVRYEKAWINLQRAIS
ncbi:hypothetical protein C2S52_023625 [Perilla frutescens var. hirtella]|nr:hypothetical protein C2S52_023625 [Perilla frutescens var. hirtella]